MPLPSVVPSAILLPLASKSRYTTPASGCLVSASTFRISMLPLASALVRCSVMCSADVEMVAVYLVLSTT